MNNGLLIAAVACILAGIMVSAFLMLSDGWAIADILFAGALMASSLCALRGHRRGWAILLMVASILLMVVTTLKL